MSTNKIFFEEKSSKKHISSEAGELEMRCFSASSFAESKLDDIPLKQGGASFLIGLWKHGKNNFQGTGIFHSDNWAVLGLHDMDGDGFADLPVMGNLEENSRKIIHIGYYKNGVDRAANWRNIGKFTVTDHSVWTVRIGNITGKENGNSVVFFSPSDGKLGAWLDGTAQWVEIPGAFNEQWELLGCGDFEGTGKDSILMSFAHGSRYYALDLKGNLKELSGLGSDGKVCGIGDLDGRGKDSILFVHEKIGILSKWSMGKLIKLGEIDTSAWKVIGCGRYSGKDAEDILLQNKSTGLLGYYAGGNMSDWHEIGVLAKDWEVIPGSRSRKSAIPAYRGDVPREWFPLKKIRENLPIALMLLRNDIKAKFRHSILGVFWLFIPPLLVLLIYVYMFSFIFKMRWPDAGFTSRWGMGLFIYTGMTIYSAFSDSIMGSLNLLVSRGGMLKKVPFPFELFPVSLANSNILISGCVLWIIFLLSLITGGCGSWMVLIYFPLIYLPFAFLVTGVSWITSALGIFFRDLGNLFGVLLLLGFFASPILYSEKMIPAQFSGILKFNPLSPVIQNIRCIFLQNCSPDWTGMLYSWCLGVVVFHLGFYFFQYQRRHFPDVI